MRRHGAFGATNAAAQAAKVTDRKHYPPLSVGPYSTLQVARFIVIETVRWAIHIGAVAGVFCVGVSWPALIALVVFWAIGVTGTTVCYHRYFAHRCFRTSRWFQFVLALWGSMSLQRGPIWWTAVHRHHHAHSDSAGDWHSPRHGFWHAHMGWLASPRILSVDFERAKDLMSYPELRWLDLWYHIPSVLQIVALALVGSYLESNYPEYSATAWQMVVWGFLVKSVVVWQLSFAVNSMLHKWGKQPFANDDDSRNGPWWFCVVTWGDGYHNNHHRQPSSARHGFYQGETDLSYGVIKLLEQCGLVWDVKTVSQQVLEEGRFEHG